MIYVSGAYYVFLIACVLLYYLFPKGKRWYILLIASAFLYLELSREHRYLVFIFVGNALISFIAALIIDYVVPKKTKSILLFLSIIVVSVLLIFDKVYFLFSETMYGSAVNDTLITNNHSIVTPIGLSFYTLQIIAYLVDVYRGKIKPQVNFFKYFLFISFFPQILQGPIPRYEQLSEQLFNGNSFDQKKFTKSFMLILWGFFMKLVIADKAGIIVDNIFDTYPTYVGAYIWLGGFLYSIQLYIDFLSATTLSQGAAGLFGIDIVDNFNHPYFSKTIKEFWRRWHISLSLWLRDYIYIPLGGNRKGKISKYINIIITFLVSGLWHGNGLTYIIWGILHGIYQIIGEIIEPMKHKVVKLLRIEKDPFFHKMISRIVTFFLVMIGWIIFRANSLTSGLGMLRSMFTVINPWVIVNDSIFFLGVEWRDCVILVLSIVAFGVISCFQEKGICIRDTILQRHIAFRWGLYIGGIVIIMLFGTYGYGYDTQSFIYGGF